MKYESPNTYHSKYMANVKVFRRKTDRRTGQNLYAPDLSILGHNKSEICHVGLTRCVLKHKCPRTRPIPEVAVIVKTKIQGQGQKLWH
jgi:hypothetical protein